MENTKLKKDMRPIDVWGLALGAIIGWGCFVLPGNSFLPEAGPLGTTLGLAIGATLMVVISFSYGYLIRKYPVSGGEFVYAGSAFGKTHGFVCGWFMMLAYWSLIPLNGTAVALISRYLFPGIIQQGLLYQVAGWDVYAGEVVVASIFMIVMAIVNIRGVKNAAWLQTAIALTLVGGILIITSTVLIQAPDMSNLSPGFPEGQKWFKSIFAIVAMSPWAFIGFDCIPQAAEEYKFSHKKSLGLMILAIVIAAILYIAVNFVTSVVIPWKDLIAQNPFWATGKVVEMSMGKIGLFLLGLAMSCAVISGMNAFYIATSRLMYSMSKVNALPKVFGRLHSKYHTPHISILVVMLLSLIAPWFGREVLVWIVDMTSVGATVVFAYTTISASKIALSKGDKSQVVLGTLGFILSGFFMSLLLVPGMPGFLSRQSFISLIAWIVLGVIFYFIIYKKYIVAQRGKTMDKLLDI